MIGNFKSGWQVGGEALFVHVSSDDRRLKDKTATGILPSAFVGYKHAADFGLTFDGQVGAMYNSAASKVQAMLNLNLGWSF